MLRRLQELRCPGWRGGKQRHYTRREADVGGVQRRLRCASETPAAVKASQFISTDA
jgi:hypothetical protein